MNTDAPDSMTADTSDSTDPTDAEASDTQATASGPHGPADALRALLTDPDAFFRRRADDPSFAGPVAVVLVVAGLGAVGALPVMRATTATMPAEADPFVSVVAAVGVLGGVVGVFVTWALFALAFHVVSAIAFGASGSFRTTLALTGWGLVPRIPEAAIAGAVAHLVFADVRFPSDPQQLSGTVRALRSDPLFVVAGVLGIAFLAWSALLWTFAMRRGRNLTLRQATLTVAGPVALALVVDLLGLLGVF